MNEALTKKLYNSFDVQGVGIDALNAALDYISDMFKYQAAGMTVDYIKESINDLTSVIFKSAGDKYLKAIQPEDEAVNRIKELRKALYNHDVFVPSADLKELLYLYGDIKTIRKKFAFFGLKMKTTGIFRQLITMNQIYAEIQPSFADLLPDELNHLDEYSNLFSLIDYQPIRYNKISDDPLYEERKEDLNNTIFEKIDKPEYTPPQESAAAADIYDDMLKQDHLLIAGTTGSGKSFIIKRLIEHLKDKNCSIVLFDPKIVELIKYKKMPNVTMYQTEAERIAVDLKCLCYAMDQHFIALSKRELTKTTAEHTYIIIDEFADLVNIPGNKKLSKEIFAYCQKIAQKGRAAGVHLILATQRPTREVIPGSITCCMTGKVALRTATAQESRNIMQISGAENFPRIGKALYHTPDLLKPEIIDII